MKSGFVLIISHLSLYLCLCVWNFILFIHQSLATGSQVVYIDFQLHLRIAHCIIELVSHFKICLSLDCTLDNRNNYFPLMLGIYSVVIPGPLVLDFPLIPYLKVLQDLVA